MQQFIAAFLAQCEEFILAVDAARTEWSRESASGVNLDTIGGIVGENRSGILDDAVYRDMLNRAILRNTSEGHINSLLQYVALRGSYSFIDWTEYPGVIVIYTDSTDSTDILPSLQKMVAGGVRVIFVKSQQLFYYKAVAETPPAWAAGYNSGTYI